MNGLRIPAATYRLQFRADFRFDDARTLVPYLDALGITDIYASPILKTRAGSTHGYDITDHSQINPELGGEEALRRLTDALRERQMGFIVDVVPNHMEINDLANRWWLDVLENGPGSLFASCFDIDWKPPKSDLAGRVLLPVLGDQFGRVLENGEVRLNYDEGVFVFEYCGHRFPLDPRTTVPVLESVAEHVRITVAPDDHDLVELKSIIVALKHLPDRTTEDAVQLEERRRETRVAKRRLRELTASSAAVRRAIKGVVVDWCGCAGESKSFDRLEELLAVQAYRLCYWRVAADEINYRRFFDINNLAAIRVEHDTVFAAVHETILRLVGEGRVTGLRIDHPDGLYDPEHYFATLQAECRRVLPAADHAAGKPAAPHDNGIYCVAEKILSRNEQLPLAWAVHGTTGYEMLNLINGLFVDPRGQEPLVRYYSQINSAATLDFEDLAYECKKVILRLSVSAELHGLARRLDRISEQHRCSRDFTLWGLFKALREVIACFPVYRTYMQRGGTELSPEDRRHVEVAVQRAKRRNPGIDVSLFDFLQSVLLMQAPAESSDSQAAERREFLMKMQQLTGPVMAKGLEDTAFYRVFPLVSLNEVGSEPQHFAVSLEEFHRHNTVRCARCPYGLVATSTHDMKRSEDARAWLNVLSEVPEEWTAAVERWREMNRRHKPSAEGAETPDANEEYLLYQTLIGVWPLAALTEAEHLAFTERIAAYMEKALREAKVHTSWISPNSEYEQAVHRFVHSILARDPQNAFVSEVEQFHERLNYAGLSNALAQRLLHLTVPGVADIYQGCELWNFTLVDPDNRRPVDFATRRDLLEDLRRHGQHPSAKFLADLVEHWRDGRIKLFVTERGLNFRSVHRSLFLEGEYLIPTVTGQRAGHVGAFVRRNSTEAALVVVPRLTMGMTRGEGLPLGPEIWEDTHLTLSAEMPSQWRDVFTGTECRAVRQGPGQALRVADLLRHFPVALLEPRAP